MSIEKELAFYGRKLPEWLEHEGKFVLIHDETLIDVFNTYADAIKAGYEKFGLDPFLVRQVHTVEQAQLVTRLAVGAY